MTTTRLQQGDALLIVDVQNDFLPGGALGVPEGDTVVAPLNAQIARFTAAGLPVFATRDWHPENRAHKRSLEALFCYIRFLWRVSWGLFGAQTLGSVMPAL